MSHFPHVAQKFHLDALWEGLWKARTTDLRPTLRALDETIRWCVILYRGWCLTWSTAKWCCTKHRKPRKNPSSWNLLETSVPASSIILPSGLLLHHLAKQESMRVKWLVIGPKHPSGRSATDTLHCDGHQELTILTGISKASYFPSNCSVYPNHPFCLASFITWDYFQKMLSPKVCNPGSW